MEEPLPRPAAPAFSSFTRPDKKVQKAVFKRMVASSRASALAELASHGALSGEAAPPPPLRLRPLTVVVRKRPMNSSELQRGEYDVLTVLPHPRRGGLACGFGPSLVVHEPRVRYDLSQSINSSLFSFDRAYGEGISTESLYSDLLAPVIGGLLRGLQATVFAYGQTGSGKSYSMAGLTAAALRDVFALARECSAAAAAAAPPPAPQRPGRAPPLQPAPPPRFLLAVSYFEIYCSRCFDLLNGRAELTLREDGEGAVQVVGLTEHCTASEAVVQELLARGARERSMGVTRVNADSSRSHSVLHLALRERGGGEAGAPLPLGAVDFAGGCAGGRLLGRLTLVDLAGSEAACDADPPDKATHREAAEINKSLLALKECIRAMSKAQAREGAAAAWAEAAQGGSGACDGGRGMRASSARSKRPGSSKRHDPSKWFRDNAQGVAPRTSPHTAGLAPGFAADFGVETAVSAGIARGLEDATRARRPRPPPAPHTHIPYRGSKLTQVLKDCFTSPGALTIMLATAAPSSTATEHSLNTLRYAARLKEVGVGREGGGAEEPFWQAAGAAAGMQEGVGSAAAGGGGGAGAGAVVSVASPPRVRENAGGVMIAAGAAGTATQQAQCSIPWWVRGAHEPTVAPPRPSQHDASFAVLGTEEEEMEEVGQAQPCSSSTSLQAMALRTKSEPPLQPPPPPSFPTTSSSMRAVPPPPPSSTARKGAPSSATLGAARGSGSSTASLLNPGSSDASLLNLLDSQIGHLLALRARVSCGEGSSGAADLQAAAMAAAAAVAAAGSGSVAGAAGSAAAAAAAPTTTPALSPGRAVALGGTRKEVPKGYMLPPAPRPPRSISTASALQDAKAVAKAYGAMEAQEHARRGSAFPSSAAMGAGAGAGSGAGAAPPPPPPSSALVQRRAQRDAHTLPSAAAMQHYRTQPSPYAPTSRPAAANRAGSKGKRVASQSVSGQGGRGTAPPTAPPPPRGSSQGPTSARSGVLLAHLPSSLPSSSSSSTVFSTTPRSLSPATGASLSAAPPLPAPQRQQAPSSAPVRVKAPSAAGGGHGMPPPPVPRHVAGAVATGGQLAAEGGAQALAKRRAAAAAGAAVPPSLLSSFLALVKKSSRGSGGGEGSSSSSSSGSGSVLAAYTRLGGGPAPAPASARAFAQPPLLPRAQAQAGSAAPPPPPTRHSHLNPAILSVALMAQAANPVAHAGRGGSRAVARL